MYLSTGLTTKCFQHQVVNLMGESTCTALTVALANIIGAAAALTIGARHPGVAEPHVVQPHAKATHGGTSNNSIRLYGHNYVKYLW